jgi:thiol:disulfide interchange protein
MILPPFIRTICLMLILGNAHSFQTSNPERRVIRTTSIPQFYTNSEVEGMEGSPSFRQRMLNRLGKNNDAPTKRTRQDGLFTTVRTLEEFKKEVADEAKGLVVVWYYAPWCRACKHVAPGFVALARRHPDIKFVQVPALKDNTALHQGLGVPSVPYIHLFHPEGGLVEEQRFLRAQLSAFHKKLEDYQQESCSLLRGERWSPFYPYDSIPTEK